MSTTAQILANRENSQSSTGPRTPEGKLASSRNAMSHGLSAADPVLPHEDRNQFNALLQQYLTDFSPATSHEEFLVAQMAGARWKLERVERIEAILLSNVVIPDLPNAPPEILMAQMMLDKNIGNGLTRLDRYRANLERTYLRGARESRLSRKLRNEPTPGKPMKRKSRQCPTPEPALPRAGKSLHVQSRSTASQPLSHTHPEHDQMTGMLF